MPDDGQHEQFSFGVVLVTLHEQVVWLSLDVILAIINPYAHEDEKYGLHCEHDLRKAKNPLSPADEEELSQHNDWQEQMEERHVQNVVTLMQCVNQVFAQVMLQIHIVGCVVIIQGRIVNILVVVGIR